MSERRNWITQKELRMNAYYYSFSSTKCRAVDEILSAIACAGKAYHHTRDWDDDCDGTEPTYPDLIQEAADRAAKRIAELEAALGATHKIVVDAALTGFNPSDGDWADQLFRNQGKIFDLIKSNLIKRTSHGG